MYPSAPIFRIMKSRDLGEKMPKPEKSVYPVRKNQQRMYCIVLHCIFLPDKDEMRLSTTIETEYISVRIFDQNLIN
jgi:hypothetical protein